MTMNCIRYRQSISAFFALLLYCQFLIPIAAAARYKSFLPVPKPLPAVVWNIPSAPINPIGAGAATNNVLKKPLASKKLNSPKKVFGGGPSQPEMQAFTSVNGNNLVDLFSGDFSYSIPLMDVGGYPLTLGYRSGITMDQEASWVGLGWNLNPGTVSRNMRGIPDDFTGTGDSITKTTSMNPNKTTGVSVGADVEFVGMPVSVGVNMGFFKNNYKGWGMESGLNASISAGTGGKGSMTAGLSFNNNSQDGISLVPSFAAKIGGMATENQSGYGGSFSISAPYNSRSGIKVLQMSAGLTQYTLDKGNQAATSSRFNSYMSFASPTFIPSISIPYTSEQFSFTAKVGAELTFVHPSVFVSGYQSKQYIADEDKTKILPAYGYLNFQDGNGDIDALLDFNREKEIPYREKPATPHIALPFYTYDLFSVTGEGTGGQFRAYRGDIGYVHDHFMRTRDNSGRFSADVGLGDLVHAGVDLNLNRSITQTNTWTSDNALAAILPFKSSEGDFSAAYFRNPSEKTILDKDFYAAIGEDKTVAANLFQAGSGSSFIQATNVLAKYQGGIRTGESTVLNKSNSVKSKRDKRSQVISYLSAKEAETVGLDKYIESYTMNVFNPIKCNGLESQPAEGGGSGLPVEYYLNTKLTGIPETGIYGPIDNFDKPRPDFPEQNFSVRWNGRLKVPTTGTYQFRVASDDGLRIWINDSLVFNRWNLHSEKIDDFPLNLEAGRPYKIKMEYFQQQGKSVVKLHWFKPGMSLAGAAEVVPMESLYGTAQTEWSDAGLRREKRANGFRKTNHISEVSVLNSDGRRYVYGIPVYNLKQRESTFSVDGRNRGNKFTGMVGYSNNDDSVINNQGRDKYFSSEEMPAYAHSFLLTGLLSPDYVDVTGNGVSDDDLGDAVKFNYSRVAGVSNPYGWRLPSIRDSVTLNENLKTDYRDDKGNLIYGEKELWYMHSIFSKTMVATFVLENRSDLPSLDRRGDTTTGKAKRLKEINLYSKADYFRLGTNAKPIKTVHFDYSYELCKGAYGKSDSGKLTLKKVWFTYNGNSKGAKNPYIFNYNATNPDYNLRSFDAWGNFKEASSNPGYSPAKPLTNAEYPFPLQDSSVAATNAGAWALDSIVLPSGGGMRIVYESDDYGYVQQHSAMQMCKVKGFGKSPSDGSNPSVNLYSKNLFDGDNLYVYISVPRAIHNTKEVYEYYLKGVDRLYLRLAIEMPADLFGSGTESVPAYVRIDGSQYGRVNDNLIWVKMKGVSFKGDDDGSYSPVVKAAMQFLKMNLPSKAYPGSENGDDLGAAEAIKMIVAQSDNYKAMILGYDNYARTRGWAISADTSRSYARLNNPYHKKYGGGHRVKKLLIFDNWDKMTAQRAAVYGQEYSYTMLSEINGASQTISSGVASFEPGIGGEENPFRKPIEYKEQLGILGPVNMGYTEEPLGESLFPSPSVGYRSVRTRNIHYRKVKSANGFTEAMFYTAYDYPTIVEHTLIDDQTKKRYRPALANFLRINARHFVTVSQGFKIELNDMHGKPRSQAAFSQTDMVTPVTYTEYIYRSNNLQLDQKKLSNEVMAIEANGDISATALIGQDVELMSDFREQQSVVNGNNFNINTDIFAIPPPPFIFAIPTLLNLAQREENKFRSIAITKVVQRYGILDSVIQIDKGSRVVTRDLLYDAETGDVVLNRTMNGFGDPVFSYNYPSHWAYDGMGLAYKNIDMVFSHLKVQGGKITEGLPSGAADLFVSGDELLASGKVRTGGTGDCDIEFASFPQFTKLWVLDTAVNQGGTRAIYLIDQEGRPYTGYDVTLKVTRSGRKNQLGSVGSVALLDNPLQKNESNNTWSLDLTAERKVINASAQVFDEHWKVANSRRKIGVDVPVNQCPPGFEYSVIEQKCIKDTAILAVDSIRFCEADTSGEYSRCGAMIYHSFSPYLFDFVRERIDTSNLFWRNNQYPNGCPFLPLTEKSGPPPEARMGSAPDDLDSIASESLGGFSPMALVRYGVMNRTVVWPCADTDSIPTGEWWDITVPIEIPVSDTFYIGIGADDNTRIRIDGNIVYSDEYTSTSGENFRIWHLIPVYLTQGTHYLGIEAKDNGFGKGIGVEVYHNTPAELKAATGRIDLDILFSTESLINVEIPKSYSCPAGYDLTRINDQWGCRMTADSQDSIIATECLALSDTLINPYAWGFLGNWRPKQSYVPYADRAETDPTAATDIRHNGTVPGFAAFWTFQDGVLTAAPDTSIWVWNSHSTLFNKRGLELENTDPLGRYNAGLYGYQQSMPVAVVQNARYRESAFEGFEDYGFKTQYCDTACPADRHMDFGAYQDLLDSVNRHSGKYSLKVASGEQASLSFSLGDVANDGIAPPLAFRTVSHNCGSVGAVLRDARITSSHLLPIFSPGVGTKMLLSAWVKEAQECTGATYTQNKIVVGFNGGDLLEFHPVGGIIEGWQRYEAVFEIPSDANGLVVSLQASGSTEVYFDDLRLHPFNANMKSFVYHPGNLRLMAELDENNYATFYEYDDEGTLIRLKKETIKGIQTIKETRSALKKN